MGVRVQRAMARGYDDEWVLCPFRGERVRIRCGANGVITCQHYKKCPHKLDEKCPHYIIVINFQKRVRKERMKHRKR